MNKSELVKAVAADAGMTQADAGKAIDAVVKVVSDTLKKGDTVAIAGFGTFAPKKREAREGRNPRTGDPVKIPARTTASFKPSAALKDLGAKAGKAMKGKGK